MADKDTINIAIIAGVRAQYIKLASIQRTIDVWNTTSEVKIHPYYINSGQHYDHDLSGIFIQELDIHIDVDLTGQYSSSRPIDIFGEMIVKIYDVLSSLPTPLHWVIVFGDANTTLAGAIASVRKGVKLIHVEAGIRSGTKTPEETNRIITDHISDVLFVSSKHYLKFLNQEGIHDNVYWTGDIVYDLIKQLNNQITDTFMGYPKEGYILASIHREENVLSDEIMRNVMDALNSYSKPVVFIAHPRVRRRIEELGIGKMKNIGILNTLPYIQMLSAIKGSYFLFTDSGAFQRESYYLGKRCLTRQNEPHWASLIDAGIHHTVGYSINEIKDGFQWVEEKIRCEPIPAIDDFGDGNSGIRILDYVEKLQKRYYNKAEHLP